MPGAPGLRTFRFSTAATTCITPSRGSGRTPRLSASPPMSPSIRRTRRIAGMTRDWWSAPSGKTTGTPSTRTWPSRTLPTSGWRGAASGAASRCGVWIRRQANSPPSTLSCIRWAARSRAKGVLGSVEAPFLYRHDGWWYLFASFDFCCKGAESSYYVVAGRSRQITGPYVDREGRPMMEGGGTVVIRGPFGEWRGPGHAAILRDAASDYLYFHAYSAATGRPALHISPIVWEQGWPTAAPLP